jgi:N-acetyl-gamma-glutamyl-phosphate reductase
MNENLMAYGVGTHRHTPEIEQELAGLGSPVTMTFTPHLVPLDQGELVSCYVSTAEPLGQDDLDAAYAGWAAELPFVEIVSDPPGVRDVRGSNVCAICVRADPRTGRTLVFAAIDNLWKGASSQAVQNLNLMFGLDETLGIEP